MNLYQRSSLTSTETDCMIPLTSQKLRTIRGLECWSMLAHQDRQNTLIWGNKGSARCVRIIHKHTCFGYGKILSFSYKPLKAFLFWLTTERMHIVDLATSIKKYSNDHYVLHHHPHLWLLWQLPLWLQWELLFSRLCTRGDSCREDEHIPQRTIRHRTSSGIQLLKIDQISIIFDRYKIKILRKIIGIWTSGLCYVLVVLLNTKTFTVSKNTIVWLCLLQHLVACVFTTLDNECFTR